MIRNTVALLVALSASMALSVQAAGRERVLQGVGPEGEVVELSLGRPDPTCYGRETSARGRWPDGTERAGCHIPRYSAYAPILVRWRGTTPEGRPVEWTVQYQGLSVTYVPRP